MLAAMRLKMAKEKHKHADWSHSKIMTANLRKAFNAGQKSPSSILAIYSHCCLDDYFNTSLFSCPKLPALPSLSADDFASALLKKI